MHTYGQANREYYRSLLKLVQEALGTEEEGAALLEVARNAHNAEQELMMLKRRNKK